MPLPMPLPMPRPLPKPMPEPLPEPLPTLPGALICALKSLGQSQSALRVQPMMAKAIEPAQTPIKSQFCFILPQSACDEGGRYWPHPSLKSR